MIERGLDQRGASAIFQLDIMTTYDTVPTMGCCRWFEPRRVSQFLCAAVVGHQLASWSASVVRGHLGCHAARLGHLDWRSDGGRLGAASS